MGKLNTILQFILQLHTVSYELFLEQNHKCFEFDLFLFVDKEGMVKIIIETKPEMINARGHNDDTPLNYASRIGKIFQKQDESWS